MLQRPTVRHLLGTVLILLLAPSIAFVQELGTAPDLIEIDWSRIEGVRPAPDIVGRAAILVDATTNTVLYARNEHVVLPPASLTKVVSIDLALTAARLGELPLFERSAPSIAGLASSQPPRSSLMFLRAGQSVSLHELLLGLSVSSGNDAAVEVAVRVSGSVPAFADRMERSARDRGIIDMRFEEPSGISSRNAITAGSFVRFLLSHLALHPDAIETYYSVREYTYPGPENINGQPDDTPIRQFNRNGLLSRYPGADGLKTGYIPAVGYNLAATAERDGRRLIALVLGVQAESPLEGARLREEAASALFDYGFEAFEVVRFSHPDPEPLRVYGAREPRVVPVGPGTVSLTIPAGSADRLTGALSQAPSMVRSDAAGDVGSVSITLDGEIIADLPLIVPRQQPGGLFRRMWDAVALAFARLRARISGEPAPLISSLQ